jgi:hypothetical protein
MTEGQILIDVRSMVPRGHTDAVVAVVFDLQRDHLATGDRRIWRRTLQVSAHQSGSLITTGTLAAGRQGCGLRKSVRRVGVEPTTRWLGVA